MDKKTMDEFFKAVGFVPPEEGRGGSGSGKSSDDVHVSSDAEWDDAPKGKGKKGARRGDGGMGDVMSLFGAGLPQWSRKAFIIAAIVLVLVIAFLYWWFHPPINIHSQDCWTFVSIFVLIPLFLLFFSKRRGYEQGTKKHAADQGKAKRFKLISYIPLAVIALGIIGAVAGWSFWPGNAARYSSVLNIENSDFATDIQEVDYNSIPVIDRQSAALLGNRTLGEIPDYVSQFEISGLYSQINYQGRPVRVSPLNYADLFKWFYNSNSGIPGYVLVDMASQDTKVVRLDTPIYISESDPLFNNLDRYVQLKYPFYMFEEKSFEIDEDGTPWWVCPVQTRTIGLFGGETIERVVLCNASTGECQDYAIGDVPQWVDRAYPSDLLIEQYNWHGSLNGGWLNSWLGQSGVVRTTPGRDGYLGYNYIAKDDDVWVYTGVTSATADNAIVGFVLVNQRTAEAHFYSIAGATEESAMASAEGQVQHLRYTSTFPLLLNINGQPTYFMSLKDSAGLVKQFAMIDIQRYQNVATGDTVSACQKSYKALLATNGVTFEGEDSGVSESTGTIRTVLQAVIDGNSHIYLTLDGDDKIYDCALPNMIEAVAFGVGDQVRIEYVLGEPTCTVQSIADPAKASSTSKDSSADDDGSASASDQDVAGSDQAESASQASGSSEAVQVA